MKTDTDIKETIFEHFNKEVEDYEKLHKVCRQENGQDALHLEFMYMALGSRYELEKLIAEMGWADDCYKWAAENFGEDKKRIFMDVLGDFLMEVY